MRAGVAVLAIVSLLSPSVGPRVAAQTPAASRAPATDPAAVDGGWPRTYITPSGAALALYQPQVASWVDQKHATLYSAVSYTQKGAKQPALGTVKIESETSVAVDERLVSFSDLKIAEPSFPTLERDAVKTVVSEIVASVPLNDRVIGLDRVLANIDTSQIIPKNVEGVKADPPTIFFSQAPAVLVNIDGEPIWAPIPQNDLRSAVNTNWDLFEHAPSKTYYLRNDKTWMKSSDVKGPWTPAGKLPASFDKLPADENWKDVKATLPGKKLSASDAPKVFVSFEPAELILLKGKPSYEKVQGATQLLWVNNTDSDVFRMSSAGAVYFLVAGRWFSAPDFMGPWTFATPNLPDDFKKIPLEHERSRVLASVPGTPQAIEAVLLAGIPQTARVNRTVMAPEVVYQGAPEFQPIEKTSAQRAVNTDKDILKVGDLYYMCFQGVWFMSKTPTGPWEVTAEVPKTIYEIPVSSPSHAVTYVTVEDSDNDAVVFATAAAFTGVMVAWGCAVWGTGYYYPPYVWYGGGYPYYRPYLSDLRVWRLLQPLDRRVQSRRGSLRSLRRSGRRPALQPENRDLLARSRRLRPVRRARRRQRLQPAYRRIWHDPTRIECLRQLGADRRRPRRPVGHLVAVHQQRHRQHDARDPRQRGRRRGHQERCRRRRAKRCCANGRRRRVRRPRRQRVPKGGRELAEVRRWRLERCRTDTRAATAGPGPRDASAGPREARRCTGG